MELKALLDAKYLEYHQTDFIANDPISIPHKYSRKEDIEIMAFLASTIAWGNRKSIIRSCERIEAIVEEEPYNFIKSYGKNDISLLEGFVHRTFNATDLDFFFRSLGNIYKKHGGLEAVFQKGQEEFRIHDFKKIFFSIEHPTRTMKHVSDPLKGSSSKRLNMFLRWMCRKGPVDFGLWDISSHHLFLPLDVHTGKVGRSLGLLKRKQNDWKAVAEITNNLKKLDASDPVKYDFALFGMGVNQDLKI
jgi:uncharacterized protein (TIGR02757 family)